MKQQQLADLGWHPYFETAFEELNDGSLTPGRVAIEHRRGYTVLVPGVELEAEIPGKLRKEANLSSELPAVGDWVALRRLPGEDRAIIEKVLPRRSKFSRKVAGFDVDEQVVAANVDTVFLVSALDQDLNLRRIERYLTLAWDSGAQPVVILTKSDLHDDVAQALADVTEIAPGASVHAVSNKTGEGLDELETYLEGVPTIALMGSSGVGKSSLINTLAGSDRMRVADIRWDGKGRHTTTHRELLLLPSGAWVIDTPGMRELQLWDASEGLETAFSDVMELAAGCKFNDCQHDTEPGCAVKEAIADGTLDADRFASYNKQLREMAALARKLDKRLANEEAKKWKQVNKEARGRTRIR